MNHRPLLDELYSPQIANQRKPQGRSSGIPKVQELPNK
jgi:hypothetical protein